MPFPTPAITPLRVTPKKNPCFYFSKRGFFLLLLGLVAAHTLGDALWELSNHILRSFSGHEAPAHGGEELVDGVTWMLALAGGLLLIPVGRHLMTKRLVTEPRPWYIKLAAVIGVTWFAYGGHAIVVHGITHSVSKPTWTEGVLLLLGAAALGLVDWKKHAIIDEGPEISVEEDQIMHQERLAWEPPHHLIALVSLPNGFSVQVDPGTHSATFTLLPKPGAATNGPVAPPPTVTIHGPADYSLDAVTAALTEAISTLQSAASGAFNFVNWLQLLRAFTTKNLGLVPKITLIGSEPEYLETAKQLLRIFFPSAIHYQTVMPFHEINRVREALEEAMASAHEPAERTLVDLTGGFAICSIAAALQTAHLETLVQWVPTGYILKEHPANFIYDIQARREVAFE